MKPDNFLFLTKQPDSPIRATDFGLSIRRVPWLAPLFLLTQPVNNALQRLYICHAC